MSSSWKLGLGALLVSLLAGGLALWRVLHFHFDLTFDEDVYS